LNSCLIYYLQLTHLIALNLVSPHHSEPVADDNLAKSLSDGREGLPRLLARKDTGGGIASPAGSQGHGRGRLLRRLARNDGRKMARKDGKIIVIARSEAIAKRRRGERVL